MHFALVQAEVDALRSRTSHEERLDYLVEEIEERFFEEEPGRVAETDKAWDAIHRILTAGTLDCPASQHPLTHVVLGGESLYEPSDYIMVLKTPEDVRAADEALRKLDRRELERRYRALDSTDYEREVGEDDWGYTWEWFVPLRAFWSRAAAAGQYVLFTADQ